MHALQNLIKYDQSYWLDNLTRDMITSNALHTRVTQQGLRGMTSNSSTFNKAISGSSDYDSSIAQLVQDHQSDRQDVQAACDVLRPVYDASEGQDGFVSLEVSPHLAYDTEGTIEEAAVFGVPSIDPT